MADRVHIPVQSLHELVSEELQGSEEGSALLKRVDEYLRGGHQETREVVASILGTAMDINTKVHSMFSPHVFESVHYFCSAQGYEKGPCTFCDSGKPDYGYILVLRNPLNRKPVIVTSHEDCLQLGISLFGGRYEPAALLRVRTSKQAYYMTHQLPLRRRLAEAAVSAAIPQAVIEYVTQSFQRSGLPTPPSFTAESLKPLLALHENLENVQESMTVGLADFVSRLGDMQLLDAAVKSTIGQCDHTELTLVLHRLTYVHDLWSLKAYAADAKTIGATETGGSARSEIIQRILRATHSGSLTGVHGLLLRYLAPDVEKTRYAANAAIAQTACERTGCGPLGALVEEVLPLYAADVQAWREAQIHRSAPCSLRLSADDYLAMHTTVQLGGLSPYASTIEGFSDDDLIATSPMEMMRRNVGERLAALCMKARYARELGDDAVISRPYVMPWHLLRHMPWPKKEARQHQRELQARFRLEDEEQLSYAFSSDLVARVQDRFPHLKQDFEHNLLPTDAATLRAAWSAYRQVL